jgi:hypothetical protein
MYGRHIVAAGRRWNRAYFREFDPGSHFGLVSARRDRGIIISASRPFKSHNFQDLTLKLSSSLLAIQLSVTVAITGCATSTQPVADRLDPNTATTVSVINKPVELVGEGGHGTTGTPFAFFAPFQTDRAGSRASYLWVSAPSIQGAGITPKLMCDERQLTLPGISNDLGKIGLSSPPYASPVPWNMQWYFQLPDDVLDCLAGARTVALESYGENGAPERFTVEGKDLGSLKEFKAH